MLSELKTVLKVFLKYGPRGLGYPYWRYVVAPRLIVSRRPLEKPVTRDDLSMHMLFGHRDVLIAVWSLASFYAVSKTIGHLTIHNDGTLTAQDEAVIARLFPSARILHKDELGALASKNLEHFPAVKDFFTMDMWQARKLLDPYLSAEHDYILLMDSDVLWFKNPSFLEQDSRSPLMMSNGVVCPMSFIDGTELERSRAMLNSGIVYFFKNDLELSRLNEYLVLTGGKPHHFLEQAGYAYALKDPQLLPTAEYTIKGVDEVFAIARHYTGPNRAKFFFRGVAFMIRNTILNVRN